MLTQYVYSLILTVKSWLENVDSKDYTFKKFTFKYLNIVLEIWTFLLLRFSLPTAPLEVFRGARIFVRKLFKLKK